MEQTKRLSKAEDYMGLEIVDTVIDYLWLLERNFLRRYKYIFDDLCDRYHKDNPIKLFNKRGIEAQFHQDYKKSKQQWFRDTCHLLWENHNCRLLKYLRSVITEQLEIQLKRYEKASEVLLWQWFEVIDFMYERPELINPNLLDEYIEDTVNRVCKIHRKNNPFSNGMQKRFGKYWKDKKGRWRKERRKRF